MNSQNVALEDVCEFIRDGTHSSPERVADGVPVLSAEHVRDGTLSFDTGRFTTERELEVFRKRLHPKPGDVLLTIVGTIGRVGILRNSKPFVFQRSVCVLRPSEKHLDSRYLRYCLESESIRRQLEREKKEVAQAGVYLDSLNAITIPVPPLVDQIRIAELLDRADRLRRMSRYALQICEKLVPATFIEMFGDPATNPNSYPIVLGEELFDERRGGAKCGPFGSALKNSEYVAEGVPVWTMENVQSNRFIEQGHLHITDKKFQQLRAYAVQDGDILISRAGTVGRMALVRTRHNRSIMHSNLIRLSLNSAKIIPEYFVVLMTWFGFRVAKLKTGQEDAYTFMNTGALAELPIPLPPLDDQKTFMSFMRRHEQLRTTYIETLRQDDHLYQTLLHRSFEDN
jgi:type I restriction enzyme S subunit